LRALLAAAALLGVALAAPRAEANAPPGHFIIGAGGLAGTVYDAKTKLTWQQTVTAAGYPWGSASTAGTAQNYCGALPLAGGGWRVPTVVELQSLVDYSQQGGPYIDPTAFPNTPSAVFWTADVVVGSPTYAWFVGFNYGYVSNNVQTNTFNVRCVR
jgi:hypothetical protein